MFLYLKKKKKAVKNKTCIYQATKLHGLIETNKGNTETLRHTHAPYLCNSTIFKTIAFFLT